MAGSIERVMAALELREPDRVPTFDVMEEYANIYEILGKKPVPLGFLIENKYTGWVIDRTAPLLNRLHVLDSEVDRFSHDRTEASVKFGYDSAWVMHTPIFRFRDSNIAEDIYGRYYEWRIDKKGNIMYPMYRGGMLKGPADWDAWDKRDILRHPERSNRAYKQIQKDFGEKIVVMGSFLYGLFEMSWQPLGIERWAVAIHREKDFMRRYIKFYEDWYCMMIEAMADAGLPAAVYSDDMAYKSGPMLSPKMIEEFFGDAFRRIVETAHRLGMKIVMHSDGNVYSAARVVRRLRVRRCARARTDGRHRACQGQGDGGRPDVHTGQHRHHPHTGRRQQGGGLRGGALLYQGGGAGRRILRGPDQQPSGHIHGETSLDAGGRRGVRALPAFGLRISATLRRRECLRWRRGRSALSLRR